MNRIIVLLIAALLPNGSPLFAQSHPEYIQFSPGPVKGALYKPDAGPAPHVAILIIHRTANVLASPAARQLARRGFMVLGVNPRSDNNEAAVNFEANALDIKSGVELLRKQPGITRILLWGHPTLVTAMGAHYFIRDSEIHYEKSASRDKDFIVIEGATHGISPCTACETTPGQYANSEKNFFDYVTRWVAARF